MWGIVTTKSVVTVSSMDQFLTVLKLWRTDLTSGLQVRLVYLQLGWTDVTL